MLRGNREQPLAEAANGVVVVISDLLVAGIVTDMDAAAGLAAEDVAKQRCIMTVPSAYMLLAHGMRHVDCTWMDSVHIMIHAFQRFVYVQDKF